MKARVDDSGIAASVASAAPIFALLIVLRVGAAPVTAAKPVPLELLVTVQETGWGLHLGTADEARPGMLGPTSTWLPRSVAPDGSLLRRAARDLLRNDAVASVRVRAADGVPWRDVVWAGDELAAVAPVTVDSGPLAMAPQRRLRQARPDEIR